MARALDVAGDRWTLLIVRELLPGPRRFTDLVEGLPGISRKLLTDRLRDLERDGIIARRELPPPAARQVYELTDDGRDLASAMAPLIGWGVGRMGELEPEDTFRPRWAAVGMASLANREAAAGVRETFQFLVGDSAFHFVVDDGTIELHDGRAEDPGVVWTADEETFAEIASGRLAASSAIASGALTIAGDKKATKRLGEIFGRRQIFTHAREVATGGQASER
ncbi:MAG: helix-turn-helix transcriptional regulator [Actinomycetota bacterium]|nr:helix-turn-helix transcriptional regulator [Actinomycetota bacterium]